MFLYWHYTYFVQAILNGWKIYEIISTKVQRNVPVVVLFEIDQRFKSIITDVLY